MICMNLPDSKMQRAIGILSRNTNLDQQHYNSIKENLQKYSVLEEDLTSGFKCN